MIRNEKKLRWTNLTIKDLVAHMAKTSTPVSRRVVKQLLARHRYRKRQARKSLPMGHAKGRNEQFEKIARLREEFWDSPNPILSMDTKKKELLGTYYRDGPSCTRWKRSWSTIMISRTLRRA